jgi:hypothetical protein
MHRHGSARTPTLPAALSLALLAACGGGGGGGPDPGGGGADPWTTETADAASDDTGVFPSLAVDHLGTVHVSYLDRTNETFRYARRAAGAWTRSDIASAGTSVFNTYGIWSSIAVDGAGVPSVSYHDADVAYVYAKGNAAGTSWAKTQIPLSAETAYAFLGHSAIAVDPDGSSSVHVAVWLYESAGAGAGYRPAYWTPGASAAVRVDGPASQASHGRNGIHTAIALDPSGRPHLGFLRGVDATTSRWAWAEPNGSAWTVHDIEESSVPGTYDDEKLCAIAIDANGRPHLFYDRPPSGGGAHGYRYATWNGSSWTIETVAVPPTSGLAALALALDASGVPHVAYYGANDHVYYARRTGANAWAKVAVDTSTNDTGYGVAIAVDAEGGVHIAYRDETAGTLRYATR